MINRRVALESGRTVRNFDVFDLALNRIEGRAAA